MLSSCHTGSTVLGLVVETVHQGGGTVNDWFTSCLRGRILFDHCCSGFMGFPCGSAGKESSCNVGDLSSIPRLERSPGKGNSYPLQYSVLENSTDYIDSPWGRKESDFHFPVNIRNPYSRSLIVHLFVCLNC